MLARDGGLRPVAFLEAPGARDEAAAARVGDRLRVLGARAEEERVAHALGVVHLLLDERELPEAGGLERPRVDAAADDALDVDLAAQLVPVPRGHVAGEGLGIGLAVLPPIDVALAPVEAPAREPPSAVLRRVDLRQLVAVDA
jgi:hypothetical protein